MKITKRILCVVAAFFLVGTNIGGVISAFAADAGGDAIKNPSGYRIPDGDTNDDNDTILYKTIENISGLVNE